MTESRCAVADEKRAQLLDAAERAILAEGYAGASTRRIAEEAELPLSLLHYHFGGKEGLLVAVVERARRRNQAAVIGALAGPGPAAERVAGALRLARQRLIEEEEGGRLLLELAVAALHSPPLRAEIDRMYEQGIDAVSRAAAGVIDEAGGPCAAPPLDAVASLLVGAVFGLGLQRMLGVRPEAAGRAFDLLGDLLLRHLDAPPASPASAGGAYS